jgi:uncharacterized protein
MSPKETDMDPEKNRDDSSEMIAGKKSPERNSVGGSTPCPEGPETGSNRGQDESLEEDLRKETLKWLEKAEVLYFQVSGDEHFLENVSAYIRDSRYFLEKKDLIRAFEAVIWAWAWMEIGLEKDLLKPKE